MLSVFFLVTWKKCTQLIFLFFEIGHQQHKPPLPDTIPHGNRTYRILQKKLTWYEALRLCQQNNSDLASVHSESEQLFLEDIVKQDGYPLWLGLSIHDVSIYIVGDVSNRSVNNVLDKIWNIVWCFFQFLRISFPCSIFSTLCNVLILNFGECRRTKIFLPNTWQFKIIECSLIVPCSTRKHDLQCYL